MKTNNLHLKDLDLLLNIAGWCVNVLKLANSFEMILKRTSVTLVLKLVGELKRELRKAINLPREEEQKIRLRLALFTDIQDDVSTDLLRILYTHFPFQRADSVNLCFALHAFMRAMVSTMQVEPLGALVHLLTIKGAYISTVLEREVLFQTQRVFSEDVDKMRTFLKIFENCCRATSATENKCFQVLSTMENLPAEVALATSRSDTIFELKTEEEQLRESQILLNKQLMSSRLKRFKREVWLPELAVNYVQEMCSLYLNNIEETLVEAGHIIDYFQVYR